MNQIEDLFRKIAELHESIVTGLKSETANGKQIDDFQVATRHVAQLSTQMPAFAAVFEYAKKFPDLTNAQKTAQFQLAELYRECVSMQPILGPFDVHTRYADLKSCETDFLSLSSTSAIEELGREYIEQGGSYNWPILTDSGSDEDERDLRQTTRKFAQETIAPKAEAIHRQDLIIPEEFISSMSEMGYFGMSVPIEYGGVGMSNLIMILATEELSAASLPAAGSLITRPEILSKALLKGGTEEQKNHWLPIIASGEKMVAVAVTEPNTGSDVASVNCRAAKTMKDGKEGYLLNGPKAWCTFAGRADLLALLARTDDDASVGYKGLSLFIVEKESFTGHEFVAEQKGGGKITGKADATIGYRGMHSFTLQIEDYFVPAENLVGEDGGVGQGFYLQMDGFSVGRLQTGGRAIGVAQAALEAAIKYANERPQFGKPIAEFQNTQYEIGKMVVALEAARQLTYGAARAMDAGDKNAITLAAMAKLFACRTAVNITQKAQLLHGGWGYAEEYAISRYVADALVLPIFEGVEPILEMKVIGRAVLAR
jgi:(2S)-methylsuccinyl-CoA dehydrogenase